MSADVRNFLPHSDVASDLLRWLSASLLLRCVIVRIRAADGCSLPSVSDKARWRTDRLALVKQTQRSLRVKSKPSIECRGWNQPRPQMFIDVTYQELWLLGRRRRARSRSHVSLFVFLVAVRKEEGGGGPGEVGAGMTSEFILETQDQPKPQIINQEASWRTQVHHIFQPYSIISLE